MSDAVFSLLDVSASRMPGAVWALFATFCAALCALCCVFLIRRVLLRISPWNRRCTTQQAIVFGINHLAVRLEPWLGWQVRERLERRMRCMALPAQCSMAWPVAKAVVWGGVGGGGAVLLAAVLGYGVYVWGLVGVGLASGGSWWVDCRRIVRARRRIEHEMPFLLDMLILCVEAGQSFAAALQLTAHEGPAGPLADALQQVLLDVRAGRSRQEALQAMAARLDSASVRAWVAAAGQAERMGASMGPVFRSLARQQRAELFQRAEQRAMQAPVKLLLPLMTCIFPCSFLILAFPIVPELLPWLGN